jgi:outer membrane receptor for ferric coprogen and ferric-rhodotorulic acid
VNGPILSGKVGLPISALQISPGAIAPPGTLTVLQAGERNTGAPKYSMNLTNMYSFSEGWLKGLRVGGTVRLAWQSIYYFYYANGVTPTAQPVPHYKPNLAAFDGIFGYERRFKRYTWSVQANVYNMFNRYEVKLFPNAVSGWAGPNGANFSENPRAITVSTEIGF